MNTNASYQQQLNWLNDYYKYGFCTWSYYVERKREIEMAAKANPRKLDAKQTISWLFLNNFITDGQADLLKAQIDNSPYENPPTATADSSYTTDHYHFFLKEPCCSDEKIKKEMNQGDLWDRYKEVQCKTCNKIWVVNESPGFIFTWVKKMHVLKGNQR